MADFKRWPYAQTWLWEDMKGFSYLKNMWRLTNFHQCHIVVVFTVQIFIWMLIRVPFSINWRLRFLGLWKKIWVCLLTLLRFNQPIWLFVLPMQLCLYNENSNLCVTYCAWRGNEKQMNGMKKADLLSSPTDFLNIYFTIKMKPWKKQRLNDRGES